MSAKPNPKLIVRKSSRSFTASDVARISFEPRGSEKSRRRKTAGMSPLPDWRRHSSLPLRLRLKTVSGARGRFSNSGYSGPTQLWLENCFGVQMKKLFVQAERINFGALPPEIDDLLQKGVAAEGLV